MKTTITGLLLFCCSYTLISQSDYHPTQMLVYFTQYYTLDQQTQIAADHDMEIIWISPLSEIHLWRMQGSEGGAIPGDINERVGEVDDPNSGVNGFLDYESWVPNSYNIPNWDDGDPSGPCAGTIQTVLPYAYLEAGLRIAVLDTGVGGNGDADSPQGYTFTQPQLFDHLTGPELGWNQVNDEPYPIDDHGHGTHVAGIIAMILTSATVEAEILHYKTHDEEGKGYVSDLVYAIDRAALKNVQIINMSCSYQSTPSSVMAPLQKAIETAGTHNGVLIVTSAGNDEQDIDNSLYPNYPAAFDSENVLTVGSVSCDENPSEFSNWGGQSVDIAAPGEDIVGPAFASQGSYISKSGTSQATAIVTGVAAQLALRQSVVHYEGIRCALMEGAENINQSTYFATGGMIDAGGAATAGAQVCSFNNLQSAPSLHIPQAEFQSDLPLQDELGTRYTSEQVSLVPNPASHDFLIKLPTALTSEADMQIRLLSVDGRSYPIKSQLIRDQAVQVQPMSSMPAGVYFVYLSDAKSNYLSRLVWQAK